MAKRIGIEVSVAIGETAKLAGVDVVAAYPITIIEAIWAVIALRRFFRRYQQEATVE